MSRFPATIVGPRVTLRVWHLDDEPVLTAVVTASADHLRPWMAWVAAEPLDRIGRRRYIAGTIRDYLAGREVHYGIFLTDVDAAPGGELIVGGCGLHDRAEPDTLAIGYWVHADHVRNGIATEAVRMLTTAALDVAGIERVEIVHHDENHASGAVPKRLGYRRDHSEDRPAASGRPGLHHIWATTATEWRASWPT